MLRTMRHVILLLILGSFIFISCQKEINFEFKGEDIPLDTTWHSLLLKIVNKSQGNPDSIVISFKYDILKRLTEYDINGSHPSFTNENYKIIRNGQGNISKVIATIDDPSLSGVETTTYTIYYDASGTRCRYRIGDSKGPGTDSKDSTVYQYDVKNKITQQRIFQSGAGASPYFEVIRRNFVYDGNNNLIEATSYSDLVGSGNLQLDVVSTFGYDSENNPMQYNNESFVIGRYLVGIPSNNNIVREIIQFPQNPVQNRIQDHSYTYNSSWFPLTDIITIAGSKQQNTYYYQ